ncbi:hypothetical protein CORC01_02108 [Colletotrichum orchidophilum]|uniref:Uncharacterized protein n=1 Tax=Colletotrichum orchidophilum TaxID=1209926 RepID=A0A1G4BMM2_9PEZI|nr:uncharacterized protein CORC01_02108 [Colletotrichum orchidophilum]OHF02712.1 hypothetical protein CORC01_02108 [Colletotrichum orchidophilum]
MQSPRIRHSAAFMPASGAAISAGGECDRVLLHVPPYSQRPAIARARDTNIQNDMGHKLFHSVQWGLGNPIGQHHALSLNPAHGWTTDLRDDDGIVQTNERRGGTKEKF